MTTSTIDAAIARAKTSVSSAQALKEFYQRWSAAHAECTALLAPHVSKLGTPEYATAARALNAAHDELRSDAPSETVIARHLKAAREAIQTLGQPATPAPRVATTPPAPAPTPTQAPAARATQDLAPPIPTAPPEESAHLANPIVWLKDRMRHDAPKGRKSRQAPKTSQATPAEELDDDPVMRQNGFGFHVPKGAQKLQEVADSMRGAKRGLFALVAIVAIIVFLIANATLGDVPRALLISLVAGGVAYFALKPWMFSSGKEAS